MKITDRLHNVHKLACSICLFLDLNKEETFRDLSKPIGALNKVRLAQLKVWSWLNYSLYMYLAYTVYQKVKIGFGGI